jgi:hypothetical protein
MNTLKMGVERDLTVSSNLINYTKHHLLFGFTQISISFNFTLDVFFLLRLLAICNVQL